MAQLQTLVTKDTALKPKDYPFYPFEFTPVYSGINNSYDKSETAGIFKFGGGYIENLGFDTKEPAGKLDSKFVKVKTNQTYNRLSVQDMMATSGAAPAFHALVVKSMSNVVDLATAVVDIFTAGGSLVATTKIRSLSDVVKSLASIFPKYFYWHIDKNKNVSSQHVHFGDGGFLDNYGLMPLLRRNVKNIVVFINSDVAFKSPAVKSQVKTTDLNSILKTDNTRNGDNLINQITMDGALPCMFGLHQCKSAMKSEPVKWSGQKLKVFEREDFIKTINDFLKCADGTGPIYSNQALRVVENEFLGIKGGYTANVCFISLQSCNDWKEQLTSEIKDKINNDSSLAGFPNFGTFSATTEAKKTLTTAEEINYLLNAQEFNKKQIYLLSNLTDWTTETVFKKAELNKYFETSSR